MVLELEVHMLFADYFVCVSDSGEEAYRCCCKWILKHAHCCKWILKVRVQ